jgi:predicted RNA binding protein YcfA (HicA-like mRNA interferase family)
MKIPRDLSGHALVNALCRTWGYRVIHQEGSHIVLETEEPSHQRIAVPAHMNLRVGTLNAILRAVAKHKAVERKKLLKSLGS